MFSYRHAFHAGNHADVLKHIVLMLSLEHLTQKDAPLTVVDTHAGVGLYRLDGAQAQTSQEAAQGIAKLWQQKSLSKTLANYVELIRSYNKNDEQVCVSNDQDKSEYPSVYPGSPFIMYSLLRAQDQLHVHEIHPADQHLLADNIEELKRGSSRRVPTVHLHIKDGFSALKGHLPPISRRGAVLMDPSYEIKTDYQQVQTSIDEALKRFATGVYMVWYPVIDLPQAQQLPKQLKRLAEQHGRGWLHATLHISAPAPHVRGMLASGMFVINPPYSLQQELKPVLEELVPLLKIDQGAQYTLEQGES